MKLEISIALILAFIRFGYADEIIGVAPKDQELYQADADGKWKCLSNPEIVLNFNQINDDFCDCPDGSDEPGTSACPQNKFYCRNEGHIPNYISSSKVNDGVCDYDECCDGSDEWNTPVDCPNRCEEIHKAYEAKAKLEKKEYTIGLDKAEKIKRAAQRLRGKLEGNLEAEEQIVGFIGKELKNHQKLLEQYEGSEISEVKAEIKKVSAELENEIAENFNKIGVANSNLQVVHSILSDLVAGFNENLNDEAVKSAVENFIKHQEDFKQFYYYLGTEVIHQEVFDHLGRVNIYESIEGPTIDDLSEKISHGVSKFRAVGDRLDELEEELNALVENYNPNFNDPNVKHAVNSFKDYKAGKSSEVLDIPDLKEFTASKFHEINGLVEKLKEAQKKQFGATTDSEVQQNSGPIAELVLKDGIISRAKRTFRNAILSFLGVTDAKERAFGGPIPENQEELLSKLSEIELDYKNITDSVNSLRADLAQDFGPYDVLRALDDISIKNHIGEYDYQVFYTGDVFQEGHGSRVKIGTYASSEVELIDDNSHKLILKYENGDKCWNGPKRSAVVTVECGANPEILTVTEPEKCEYHFRVKAPIGCKIPDSE